MTSETGHETTPEATEAVAEVGEVIDIVETVIVAEDAGITAVTTEIVIVAEAEAEAEVIVAADDSTAADVDGAVIAEQTEAAAAEVPAEIAPADTLVAQDGVFVLPRDVAEQAPVDPDALPDTALLEAHDLALAALKEITPAASIGAPLGHRAEADGVVALLFENKLLGYPGWFWTVFVARVNGLEPTVLEAELLPGDDALLAPDWVPWAVRLAEYQAAQAAQAERDAEAGIVPTDDEHDDDTDELDDVDDLDAADFDEDGSPILHAGDLDGVDIDQLDPAVAGESDEDDSDDEEDSDDDEDSDDEEDSGEDDSDDDDSDDDDESDDEDDSEDDDESDDEDDSDDDDESDDERLREF